MRLINTGTIKVEDVGQDPPEYAILSHTWGEQEVTLRDIEQGRHKRMKGWAKLRDFCRVAAKDGWQYAWMDTCCIDKTSSAELSEEINSMFKHYENAGICYAYLADVNSSEQSLETQFKNSRWFNRGWTLQELLAPRYLLFVDSLWNPIGTREYWKTHIHTATKISPHRLLHFQTASVSTKLSWAANRKTKKIEDRAYSLLGLLGISMPLIYGEGERAFKRLLEELIRTSCDETVFLGCQKPLEEPIELDRSFLGRSPEDFPPGYVAWLSKPGIRSYVMTNAGLSLNAELWEHTNHTAAISLNIALEESLPQSRPMALVLSRSQEIYNSFDHDCIVTWDELDSCGWRNLGTQNILIHDRIPYNSYRDINLTIRHIDSFIIPCPPEIKLCGLRRSDCAFSARPIGPDMDGQLDWRQGYDVIDDTELLLTGQELSLYYGEKAILRLRLMFGPNQFDWGIAVEASERSPIYEIFRWSTSPNEQDFMWCYRVQGNCPRHSIICQEFEQRILVEMYPCPAHRCVRTFGRLANGKSAQKLRGYIVRIILEPCGPD